MLRSFFQKTLTLLRIQTIVAGLEISDELMRLVYFEGAAWQLQAIRLEPGILENGKIKNREKFIAALVALRAQSKIAAEKNKKMSVVVSLSSVNAYSQMFNLPPVTGEDLVKAVELNLQMASPGEAAKTYAGWQIVGKDEGAGRIDILSSFIDREIVDDMIQALMAAKFLAMAVEPRSVSLARILREKGMGTDPAKAYILVDVDNIGIDFVIIRNGEPYFEYTNRWKDIADDKGEISLEKFESQLTASLRQVLNFYGQHWPDPIAAVVISAATFQDDIERTIAQNFSFPALRMTLEMGQVISSEWLVAVGCALRGRGSKSEFGEREISLLGESWEDRFRDEQLFHLLSFWRVLVPVMMGVLALLFIGADLFLANANTSLKAEAQVTEHPSEIAEMSALEASSTQFNTMVTLIQGAEQPGSSLYSILSEMDALAAASQVAISHLSAPGSGAPVTLSGTATSEDRIADFRTALDGDTNLSSVNLPLTGIQQNGGTFSFTVTFDYIASK